MSDVQSLPIRAARVSSRESAWPEEDAAQAWHDIRSIPDAIARRAATQGGAAALVGGDSTVVTFSQLHALVSAFAAVLASAGIERQDRVGLLVPTGVAGGQLAVALASNACLVPINPALTTSEIGELVRVSRLKAVVIPRWLDTAARPAIGEQVGTIFDATLAADGLVSLVLVSGTPGAALLARPAAHADVALLLRSSGTTGAPKLIPVTHRNLLAMADRLGSDLWFKLTEQDRAACIPPLYYAAGLKTCLFVPLILGGSVCFPPEGKTFDIAEWLHVLRPTYLSVAPGLLNGLIDRARSSATRMDAESLRFIMCASAYLPEELRLAAEDMFRVPVLEFYGLSEAGVMAANPIPPGRAKPSTVGVPVPQELLIVDCRRAPVAPGTVGHIMISGPTVMPGYVTTDHSTSNEMKQGWLLTGDLGRLDEDGYLTIVGRVKEVINRGGEKVFPYEIEKALLAHPAVVEAAAFGVPHPRLGESVAAAAVLRQGSTVTPQELRRFLTQHLALFKLPRQIHLVQSLPRGNTGKLMRRALTEAYPAAPRGDVVDPECLIELEIRDIWARLLATDEIGLDDDFFERGGDSLLATEMLIELERLVGRPYPQHELSTFTIRRIAEVLKTSLPAERTLVTQLKSGERLPLFFCHGDYLTRGLYAHKLADSLPDDQPVFLLPCHVDGSAGSSIEDVARTYAKEVLRVAPQSPVLVGGYCNGGLVAWHLAHLLRQEGVQVAEVLLVETISLNARSGLRRLAAFCAAAGAILPLRAGTFVRQVAMRSAWTWRRRLAHFTYSAAHRKIASSLRWEPPPELRRHAVEAGKLLLGQMSRYVPPPLDIGVTCFIAEEGRHFDTDPQPWRQLAGSVTEVSIRGTHTSAVVSERKGLAGAIDAAIQRAAQLSSRIGQAPHIRP
jgi:acyl-CoA synthetase (AMP-forming)/AMP-acid ligase II/thioesterase domain-containing protein/acyl carrier protein